MSNKYKAAAENYEKSLQYKDSLAINKAQFILKEFERQGAVRLGRGRVTLADAPTLRALASS